VSLPKSRTVLIALSSIMSIRMLGLFMILPVFSVAAAHMPGATATLVGLALGMYGLTQSLLQIPFGMLSDRIGRKPVILLGLFLLLIGSIVAAFSHSIYFLIIGRALQGAGAIGSTVLALLADLTSEQSRSKAMAFMGLSIGFAFTLAMIAGPVINHWFHLSGIFFATGLLALIGISLVSTIPTPSKPLKTSEKKFVEIIGNTQLLRLDAGIFFLHAILTALFVAVPILLTREIQLSSLHQILMYLFILIISFMCALPFIIIGEKKQKIKPIFISAIATIFIVQVGLYFFHRDLIAMVILLFVFFAAFTLLEATLPSLVSKIAPAKNKGAAMGIYSSSQFFGIFVGGSVGGWVFEHAHLSGVFALSAVIACVWFSVACTMQQPPYLSKNTNCGKE